MDRNYHIYQGLEEDIPAEDKARLDGFLKGREETNLLNEVKELEAKLRELEEHEAERDKA